MKITQDDKYETMMAEYQIIEIAKLNEILKANGIDNKNIRENICSSYFDQQGSFLDHGSFDCSIIKFSEEGLETSIERIYPEVVFSKRNINEEGALGNIEELIIPEYASNFQEYASSNSDQYFNENNETINSTLYDI